jgi:hypothetical protein
MSMNRAYVSSSHVLLCLPAVILLLSGGTGDQLLTARTSITCFVKGLSVFQFLCRRKQGFRMGDIPEV